LEENLTNEKYDAVYFPGGSGSGQFDGITPKG